MSVGFMLHSKTDAVIWRGPRKNGLIKQFLTDVYWDELDVLLIDSPPGTSDEHISITSYLREVSVDGAIIVTTPQEVALLDVRKEITFCNKVQLPILGVVENMSEFTCPHCHRSTEIFAPTTGGAQSMCQQMHVPYLGSIPISLQLLQNCETGMDSTKLLANDTLTQTFLRIVDTLFHASPDLLETYNSISGTIVNLLSGVAHTPQDTIP
uniref:Cytosolic Fe-S cluster assembly factor NUBP1 n=1 Tax=Lygus hesperus TaxID=30085 RepID=A0A0A9Y8K1_LYGHE